jgi:hypothetical protein
LYLHPGKQEWYCFGCARGGTVYGLVLWMRPELSRAQALEMVAGEEGADGLKQHTIRRFLQREEIEVDAPSLFAVLMSRYAGQPARELPIELVDALACDDPLPALRRFIHGAR